jgi:transposase
LKGHKNDFRDGEAIAEAVLRPTMKFVATKTAEQLDLQALHRVRSRLVGHRTGIINQIRAFLLERGIAVRQGLRFLRTELPKILATRCDVLSPRMVHMISDLAGDWHRLDECIEGVSTEIEALADQDPACERLMTARHRTGHIECHGGGDRQWRGILKGTRLRRLARVGAQTDVDWRPHNPWQDIQTGQSLSARLVRTGGTSCADEAADVGASRAQVLDRIRAEADAPQRAGGRARQQLGPNRLGRSQQGAQL